MNLNVVKHFQDMRDRGCLAHAYLFVGPKGSGKIETALAVARMLNCQSEGPGGSGLCGQCPSCLKIEKGNHPDVMMVERADEASIKIDQVRELIGRVQLRAFEARSKVFILKDAETLTTEAANALLKTLEEPTKDSLLILTSAVKERVLPTIRSRCQTVIFSALPREVLMAMMVRDGLPQEEASCLAQFSEGCRGRAYELRDKGFLKKKNGIIDQFTRGEMAEADLKLLSSDSDEGKEALSILMSWCRDILLLKAGAGDERVVHADRLKDLQRQASHYTDEQLKGILQTIVKTRKMIDENLNVKIPLMLLKEQLWAN